jgi:7,8-dihydro-6-hydroxymethylpterin-pyrophosphokinase
MLGPLADIASAIVHPTARESIAVLWARFDRAAHVMTRVDLGLADGETVGAG